MPGARRISAPANQAGPVISGAVLPKGTTTGVPTAAARCMGPVSLVRSRRQNLSAPASSRKVVWPARLMIGWPGKY